MNKKRLILLVIIIIGVWYFWGRDWIAKRAQVGQVPEGAKVAEVATTRPPSTSSGDKVVAEGQARVHYFTKAALASCSTETVALEQAVDPKYGHRAAGALVAMTLPRPKESADQYVSALPPGTRLLSMQLDKDGTAHADYNNKLTEELNDCAKAQRRGQIESTLREFPEIKAVRITVNGVIWE